MDHALIAALRAHARGIHCLEAATEILIGHRTWPHLAALTALITTIPGTAHGPEMAYPDWPAIITALDTGMPHSRSEQQMLRLAAGLATGTPVDLREALTGLDDHNIDLVVTAVLRTSGRGRPAQP